MHKRPENLQIKRLLLQSISLPTFPRSFTKGGVQVPQDRECILVMPRLISQPSLKIVSRVANSDTLSNLLIALMSIPVTSFYSVI
jgi:hypothetical protein